MLSAEEDNAYQDLHNNSSDHAKASSNIILLIYCSNLLKIIIQIHLSVPWQIKDTKRCLVYSVADNLQTAVVIH